ncbi:MAG: hypothetical protein JXR60_06085 [Bacteroidales bacterium]|nr:hypothetical protein [Bacteroidales bacterium]
MKLTDEQAKKIKFSVLAKKHAVSPAYVMYVITGKREANSDKAKAIMNDAQRILEIVEG